MRPVSDRRSASIVSISIVEILGFKYLIRIISVSARFERCYVKKEENGVGDVGLGSVGLGRAVDVVVE